MKVVWKGEVLAESSKVIELDGAHYFPTKSIRDGVLEASATRTRCPRKGEAHYFTVTVDGNRNMDAAWCYPRPRKHAKPIKDYVAFRKVEIEE